MTLHYIGALAAALAALAGPANARDYTAGGLTVRAPWSRATPAGAPTAVGFLSLTNTGPADRLVGGASPVAERVEVHEMSTEGGVMRMRPVVGGIPIPQGGSAELRPGGLHIMFIGLKQPLAAGQRFPATLRFQRAGEVKVEFEVVALGQQGGR